MFVTGYQNHNWLISCSKQLTKKKLGQILNAFIQSNVCTGLALFNVYPGRLLLLPSKILNYANKNLCRPTAF